MGFFDNVLATRTNGSSKKGMKKSVGGAGAKGLLPFLFRLDGALTFDCSFRV